jgi:hypothetical protein
MIKVILLVLLLLSSRNLLSCKKQEEFVMMKYAYITKENVEYKSEKGYEMVTTHLCAYETRLFASEILVEQDRQRLLVEAGGKLVLVDTLVGVDVNITGVLFSKL